MTPTMFRWAEYVAAQTARGLNSLKRVFRTGKEWPPWPKVEKEGIARYVNSSARAWIPTEVHRYDLGGQRDGRRETVKAIYDYLLTASIRYSLEPFEINDAVQRIRAPAEVLERPREGTCLDLSLLFAGICLGYELLPIVVVLQGHALVLVSLNRGLRDWKSLSRGERAAFARGAVEGMLLDETSGGLDTSGDQKPASPPLSNEDVTSGDAVVRRLVDSEEYVAIECTGFAHSERLNATEGPPETRRRVQGVMSFEDAALAGREQLHLDSRQLYFAVDIATAQNELGIQPYPLPDQPTDRTVAVMRNVAAAVVALVVFVAVAGSLWYTSTDSLEKRVDSLERQVLREVPLHLIKDRLKGAAQSECESLKKRLSQIVAQPEAAGKDSEELLRQAKETSRAAVTALLLNDSRHVVSVFSRAHAVHEPHALGYLPRDIGTAGADLAAVIALVTNDRPAAELYGVLVSAGEFDTNALQSASGLTATIQEIFQSNDDPGVHAAAYWLLATKLGTPGRKAMESAFTQLHVAGIERLSGKGDRRGWFVDPKSGSTFVFFPKGVSFEMGDRNFGGKEAGQSSKRGEQLAPVPHCVTIPRAFAVAMTEVTESQFRASGIRVPPPAESDFPVTTVTWSEAAEYCNWLTTSANDRCYDVSESQNSKRVEPVDDHLNRGGYRMPTEAEWEYAARAMSPSSFCFGSDIELLQRYAYVSGERGEVAGRRPNAFGLFDMHGGVSEWCDDHPGPYERGQPGQCPDDRGRTSSRPEDKLEKIFRGGHYQLTESQWRPLASFARSKGQHRYSQPYIGVRVALTVVSIPRSGN